MLEFIGAIMQEFFLAIVFALMLAPIAIIPMAFFVQYVSYFPRFYIGRMRLAAKLEKISKHYGLEFYRHREGYYYGRLENVDCEFSLVTPKARYAVKLIGMPNRHLNIYLTDHDVYYTQKPSIMRYNRLNDKAPVMHEIAPHRFFVNDGRVRTEDITPVYLINPCPRTLYYTKKHSNDKRQPYDGDDLDGITLYTLTGFLKRVEEDCTPCTEEEQNEKTES